MNFFTRFLVGFLIIAGVGLGMAVRLFNEQFVPGVRQSVEEMLVQTANLLAELATDDIANGKLAQDTLAVDKAFRAYAQRHLNARIYGVLKSDPDLRIVMTDAVGQVVYDSRGVDVGKDYSAWRDVGRTLRGQYGARTTHEAADNPQSAVMYVAAPIRRDGEIIGVLSVGKPAASFQNFIELAQAKVWESALWLLLVLLLVALVFSWWMTRDLSRLVRYANEVASGKRSHFPTTGRSELRRLAQALENLRKELDGKSHVEKVSQLLTHELKSPIAAIQGAAELLCDEEDASKRARLEANIMAEADRLRRIVEGTLNLARAENRGRLDKPERIALDALVHETVASRAARLEAKGMHVDSDLAPAVVLGSAFLLRQSIANLLDNAIDFSPPGGALEIKLSTALGQAHFSLRDHGPGIADFAVPRIFERFYSTPRPGSGERSSGLGLNLVQEAVRLHHGEIGISNHPRGGAIVDLRLPLEPLTPIPH
jgi:two-component system sensor histidine kinase CreC